MTDQTRFRAALCISLFLHFMLWQMQWSNANQPGQGRGDRLSQELSSSAILFGNTTSIAIESISETLISGEGMDTRARDRRAYLEAVSDAIHARRFIEAGMDRSLIGLAWFSFTIRPDGRFQGISLEESSGNLALDRAAEAALRRASGVVSRPASLGREEITLTIAVKYQYDR